MSDVDLTRYFDGRLVWLDWLAQRVCPNRLGAEFDPDGKLNPIERALATLSAGWGHLLGIEDRDLEIPGEFSTAAATTVISKWWRDGRADPLTSASIDMTWLGMFQLARDTGKARPDFLVALTESQIGKRIDTLITRKLDPRPADESALRAYLADLDEPPIPAPTSIPGVKFAWECKSSHLDIVRALIRKHDLETLATIISPMELAASLPETPDSLWEVNALEAASRVSQTYMAVPGGWPGPEPHDIPRWVRDVVTVQGARMYWSTSGFVPSWLIVARSQDELQAINRSTYNPGFGVSEANPEQIVLVLRLDFDSGEVAYPAYSYTLDDVQHVNWLRATLAVKWLRLEVYFLDADDRLGYVFTCGTPLPPEFVARVRALIRDIEITDKQLSFHKEATSAEWLLMMGHTERTFFESLAVCMPEVDADSQLGEAYRHYLRIVAQAASQALRRSLVDEYTLKEATEGLRSAVGRHAREVLVPLPLEHLEVGRGIVQFFVTVDSPPAVHAHVAFIGNDGSPITSQFEFSSEIDVRASYSNSSHLRRHLSEGLLRLRSLQELGVHSLVVSAGAGIYNLPFHEALMELGFLEVSYSHRVATLAPRPPSQSASNALVCGFSGESTNTIASVEVELSVVAELTGGAIGRMMISLPSVVHLAGHAETGSRTHQVGMWLGPSNDSPLSAAQVLLEIDASGTDLVFLSACATGAGSFDAGELIGAVPLDVAFIEKGAQVVISTSAPVNDQVACFFACVFHDELRRGSPVWSSYTVARTAAATASLGPAQADLQAILMRVWPSWRSDIERRNAAGDESWRLFRVSGRHW